MTVEVFRQNTYLVDLETSVTAVNGNEMLVAETIFNAFSGDQDSDTDRQGKCCCGNRFPCHGLIGKNGELIGYSGGLWRKKYLLDLEFKKS
jgi:hypothetical protein